MSQQFAYMQGRLNSFQKSMLHWNEMHPYSAVHVVQIRGALDATRLRTSIKNTLEQRGIAQLRLNREESTFHYLGDQADWELQTLPGGEDPFQVLVTEMERQLNLRFPDHQPFCPFRFPVVASSGSFLLGLVYFHPVADAESVVYLLKDIVARYSGQMAPGPVSPLNPSGVTRATLLRRYPPMILIRKVLTWPLQMQAMRRSHRPSHKDPDDLANGFVCFSLDPDALRSVVTAAKSWGITVNDLFIALLMKALSPCAASRLQAAKRRNMTIGCIINLRKDLGLDNRGGFGLFLGSFTVSHRVPAELSLRELAGDICRQTSRIKRQKLYLGTAIELGFARFLLSFFSPTRRKRFYNKHYPLWGGITNMNLESIWEKGDEAAPMDYFRGVSTGPITPLALSVTTFGGHANLGLSYRTSVFSKADIAELQGRFLRHLDETRNVA